MGRGGRTIQKNSPASPRNNGVSSSDFQTIKSTISREVLQPEPFKAMAKTLKAIGKDGNKAALNFSERESEDLAKIIVDNTISDIQKDWQSGREYSFDNFLVALDLVSPKSKDPLNDFIDINIDDQKNYIAQMAVGELSFRINEGQNFNPGYLKEIVGMGASFGISHFMMIEVDRNPDPIIKKIFDDKLDYQDKEKFKMAAGYDRFEEMVELKEKIKFKGRYDFWGNARTLWQKGQVNSSESLKELVQSNMDLIPDELIF